MRLRRYGPHPRYRLHCYTCDGVHGDINRHDAGIAQYLVVQALQREIDAPHFATGASEPGGRLGQTEGLAADLIGIDQDDFHKSEALEMEMTDYNYSVHKD